MEKKPGCFGMCSVLCNSSANSEALEAFNLKKKKKKQATWKAYLSASSASNVIDFDILISW